MNDTENSQPLPVNKLRGQLAMAVRWGNDELEKQFRKEMALHVIEGTVRKRLDGLHLTYAEAGRLHAAIAEHVAPDADPALAPTA